MRIKKELLVCGLAILLVASVFGMGTGIGACVEENNVEDAYLSGGGIAYNPIEIYDWYDLDQIRNGLDADYVLMNDLDKDTDGYDELVNTEEGWEPIGDYSWDEDVEFTGSFDGQKHTITGLYINRPKTYYVGLFGYVDSGEVANVRVVDVDVTGRRYVGGLVGRNWEGTVSNSYATGEVSGNWYVGGLVGSSEFDSKVESSYFNGTVSGNENVGGLMGTNFYSKICNSYFNGIVSGSSSLGGLVGDNWFGTIENSFYDIDSVLINNGHHITMGGIFHEQYVDWFNNDLNLDIEDYSDTLVSVEHNYEINSTDGMRDLLGFAYSDVYKFSLVADIDLSGEPGLYVPYFVAEFDGTGHLISNLHINIPFADHIGMFGYVYGGEIINIGVVDVDVTGGNYVGELVGSNNWGTVSNSYATGEVSGNQYVGGLVGRNWGFGGTIANSYSTGNVTGHQYVGGLVGSNNWGTVLNSYAIGSVSGNYDIGGLLGYNTGTVENSFWDTEPSGMYTSDGGSEKTTAEMIKKETFTEAEWDFEEDWDIIEEETYPFLQWQEEDTYPRPKGEHKEEDEDLVDKINETQGFSSLLLLLAVLIAVAIYKKKKR